MNNHDDRDTPGLDVYLREQKVGRLWLDEKRRFVFQYDAEWIRQKGAVPLSLHLPFRAEIYPDELSRPFFSNLLPEADIKRVIAQRLQISEGNDFAMLNSIGGECAGAVSLLPSGVTPTVKPGYRELNEKELHKIISDLPRRPLMAGMAGMRLSLAGAQNKLPVYIEDDRIFIASGNAPSSHILKPPIRDLEDTVGNEAFCMILAQSMGLSVPLVTIHWGLDRLFIITRYDRRGTRRDAWCACTRKTSARPWGICPTRNTKVKAARLYSSVLPFCRGKASAPPPIVWPSCDGRSSIS